MTESDRQRIRRIFMEVASLPIMERAAALARLTEGAPALRIEVERLLQADADAAGFMASPTNSTLAAVGLDDRSTSQVITEELGQIIGPYKLLQVIGEGGFGTVYMAEQLSPIVRRVALKIIKLGMDTRQVVARFEQERQALALMDHPNIAKVLDGGATASGRPYFVMELVKGIPITKYCDQNNLSAKERLELFIPCCQAVQHAHHKGIIHRDLKPGNILITLHDGEPVPKVIDFGIAKATNARLTEKTLFTDHHQFIGTPAYMSPEQAELSGLDIDTRADVYALGVLLYELMTGTTPFENSELMKAGYAEIQRIIREVEPPKPSTRVATLGGSLAATASRRGVEPARLGVILRGDLDWIVMKALEKDRRRRYDTPADMSRDVQRHLAGDAVLAAPPSKAYRLRKFVRRNKGRVIAAGAITAALLVGIAGTSVGLALAEETNRKLSATNVQLAVSQDEAEFSAYTANISAAQAAMNNSNWPEARRHLAECPPARRAWEWGYLNSMAELVRAMIPGEGRAYSLATDLIAATEPNDAKSVQIFSLDGKRILKRKTLPSHCFGAEFDASGERLLTIFMSGAGVYEGFQCWNSAGNALGPPVVTNYRYTYSDSRVSLSASGTHVLAYDNTSAQLHTADGAAIGPPMFPPEGITRAAFTQDSRYVLTHSAEGTVRIWDLCGEEAGEPAYMPEVPSLGLADEARRWQTVPGDLLITPAAPPLSHYVLDGWTSRGEALFQLFRELDVPYWHPHWASNVYPESADGTRAINPVAFVQSANRAEYTVSQLFSTAGDPLGIPFCLGRYYSATGFSGDGSMLAVTLGDEVSLLDRNGWPAGSVAPRELPIGGSSLYIQESPSWSSDGRSVLAWFSGYGDPGCSIVFDLESMRDRERWLLSDTYNEFPGNSASLFSAGVDLELLAAVGGAFAEPLTSFAGIASARIRDDGVVEVTPAPTANEPPTPILLSSIDATAQAILFSHDGTRLLVACDDATVRFVDTKAWKQAASIPLPQSVTSIRFGADGTRLAIRFADGSARVWDSRDSATRQSLGHPLAGYYPEAAARVEALLARDASADELLSQVRADPALNPYSRVATMRLLRERLSRIEFEAGRAFEARTEFLTREKIRAAIEQTGLPPRVKSMALARADSWPPPDRNLLNDAVRVAFTPDLAPDRYEDALLIARIAAERPPKDSYATLCIAMALHRLGRYQESLDSLAAALIAPDADSSKWESPPDTAMWGVIALSRLELGMIEDPDGALAAYERLLSKWIRTNWPDNRSLKQTTAVKTELAWAFYERKIPVPSP